MGHIRSNFLLIIVIMRRNMEKISNRNGQYSNMEEQRIDSTHDFEPL